MAAVSQELLQYQEVDAKLRTIEQEIGASEERKKYIQAKKFIEAALPKLDAQDARAVKLRSMCADLAARCEEITKAIGEYSDLDEMVGEGGDLGFYKKNAQALFDRLRSLKADLSKLVADVESVMDEYKKLKEQTIVMQKQYKEYRDKFKAVQDARKDEVEAIRKKLNAIGKDISPEILDKYNQKRKERIFPVVVPLKNDRCVCGMDFPLAQQGRLAGGNVIECEHCRRFVYKET